MREHWKTIEGFEAYEVSDLGRVRRRLPGRGTNNALTGKALKPGLVQGYEKVILRKEGKNHNKLVHRLVAEAFLPNPLNLPEVNHKGSIRTNRPSKLEWRSMEGHGQDRLKREQRGHGVHLTKKTGRWQAYYWAQYQKHHIGYFDTKKEAVAARKKAVKGLPHII